jgi:hypothetical protein
VRYCLGATDDADRVGYPYEGMEFETISMRWRCLRGGVREDVTLVGRCGGIFASHRRRWHKSQRYMKAGSPTRPDQSEDRPLQRQSRVGTGAAAAVTKCMEPNGLAAHQIERTLKTFPPGEK